MGFIRWERLRGHRGRGIRIGLRVFDHDVDAVGLAAEFETVLVGIGLPHPAEDPVVAGSEACQRTRLRADIADRDGSAGGGTRPLISPQAASRSAAPSITAPPPIVFRTSRRV